MRPLKWGRSQLGLRGETFKVESGLSFYVLGLEAEICKTTAVVPERERIEGYFGLEVVRLFSFDSDDYFRSLACSDSSTLFLT